MRKVLAAAMLACGMLGVAAAADGASDGTRQYVVSTSKGASADRRPLGHRAPPAASRRRERRHRRRHRALERRDVRADVARSDGARRRGAQPARSARRPSDAAKVRKRDAVEKPARPARAARATATRDGGQGGDPLSPPQWDMQQIGATPDGSYTRQQGSHGVRVGIIDTGIDGTHPDIAPNFDAR